MTVLIRLCLLLVLLLPLSASAQANKIDTSALQNIPVLHEGRLKPLDSFAQLSLQKLSGQKHIGKLSAMDWLTLTMFDPQNAAFVEVVKIDNENVRHKMQLDDNKELYSLTEFGEGIAKTQTDVLTLLQKPAESLTDDEKALIEAHEKSATLITLMRSFSGILPLNVPLPEKYAVNVTGTPSFLNLREVEQLLQKDVRLIVQQKGTDPSNFSVEESTLAQLGYNLQTLRSTGQSNNLLRIIPAERDNQKNWISPWSAILNGENDPAAGFILSMWADLAQSYRNNDAQLWESIAAELLEETAAQAQTEIPEQRFTVERIYRDINPYFWLTIIYAAVTALSLAAVFIQKLSALKKPAVIATVLAITAHGAALGSRIYILDRPPVGTLYESILYVSVIAALAGLLTHLKKDNPLALSAGSFSALLLLLSAPFFEPAGDNLEVLVAVLNTNFWLTTHVLVITAGYGLCLISAVLAHIALALNTDRMALRLTLQNNIYILSLVALLLTAVGTVLGGIWADQSWGRFWGWDPKENGALLIVLWLIWAQHGRVANRFKPATFLAVIAFLNVVVAISWFGVNLLNVGLHSYGFTNGMAEALITFCAVETILITTLYLRNIRKKGAA